MTSVLTRFGKEGFDKTSDSILIVFSHATGFCKELWKPVIESLQLDDVDILSMDLAGHGDSDRFTVPNEDIGKEFGLSILEAMGTFKNIKFKQVIGVGHSMGGTGLLNAECMRPGTFSKMLLVEPILFPPRDGVWRRNDDDNPMSSRAERRRDVFLNRDEAFCSLKGKGAFATWLDASFEIYIDHAFKQLPDGSLELKCAPSQEAEVYRCATPIYGQLPTIQSAIGILVGEKSTHMPCGVYESILSKFPNKLFGDSPVVLPGLNHFAVMEDPELIASYITMAQNTNSKY